MPTMTMNTRDPTSPSDGGAIDGITKGERKEGLLKTGALQNAILHSANFSSIATAEEGVIQLFHVGAERITGDLYAKVTDHESSEGVFRMRFTSVPRQIQTLLESLRPSDALKNLRQSAGGGS